MKRRNFLQVLLGLPAAVAMGADAVSALRPVKEPDVFDKIVELDARLPNDWFKVQADIDTGIKVERIDQMDVYVDPTGKGQYGMSVTELPHVQKAQADMNRMYRGFIDGQG